MREAGPKVAAQLVHALSAETFHERTERKLVELAAPVFNPSQIGVGSTGVRHCDLRKEYGIVTKRSKDDVVDRVRVDAHFLAKISRSESQIETPRVLWLVAAQRRLPVSQVSESTREPSTIGSLIIQELRCALVLPHPHVAVIR